MKKLADIIDILQHGYGDNKYHIPQAAYDSETGSLLEAADPTQRDLAYSRNAAYLSRLIGAEDMLEFAYNEISYKLVDFIDPSKSLEFNKFLQVIKGYLYTVRTERKTTQTKMEGELSVRIKQHLKRLQEIDEEAKKPTQIKPQKQLKLFASKLRKAISLLK